jgi:hypothetical protein
MEGMEFGSLREHGMDREFGSMAGFGIGDTPGARNSFGQFGDAAMGPSPGGGDGGGGLRSLSLSFPTSAAGVGKQPASDSPDWPIKLSSTSKKVPQVEDVVSWSDLCYFISLFLKYLYPLMPIVHRPTFAENLATRLDTRDPSFRALLLSIGEA